MEEKSSRKRAQKFMVVVVPNSGMLVKRPPKVLEVRGLAQFISFGGLVSPAHPPPQIPLLFVCHIVTNGVHF